MNLRIGNGKTGDTRQIAQKSDKLIEERLNIFCTQKAIESRLNSVPQYRGTESVLDPFAENHQSCLKNSNKGIPQNTIPQNTEPQNTEPQYKTRQLILHCRYQTNKKIRCSFSVKKNKSETSLIKINNNPFSKIYFKSNRSHTFAFRIPLSWFPFKPPPLTLKNTDILTANKYRYSNRKWVQIFSH